MNEKDLLYFCKLVETGNYTTTAAFFDVTQPTISMAVKRLADKFDDPLILQKNRKSKITLTDAGDLLYKRAKILLQDIASINYDVMHASDKKIRLAFSGEAGSLYIADIIQKFYQANIANLIESRIERSANAFSDLTDGTADVAIYSWMVPINDPEYLFITCKEPNWSLLPVQAISGGMSTKLVQQTCATANLSPAKGAI